MLSANSYTGKLFCRIAAGVIAFLWFYAAVSKLAEFNQFRAAMHKQPLPNYVQAALIYGLPPIEILAGSLLLVKRTQSNGLYLSLMLLTGFTGYISLVLFNLFGRIPCSCGGLIGQLGWTFHLCFNIIFLLLAITCIYLKRKEPGDKE
jgi:putative oxidoreductase